MLVILFGLVNSQATYHHLVDITLQGLKQVESYIDDCIVFSKTFSENKTLGQCSNISRGQPSIKKWRNYGSPCMKLSFSDTLFLQGADTLPTTTQKMDRLPTTVQ